MGFNYDLLIEDIIDLEEFWNINNPMLKSFEGELKETYKVKYIDLLFEFYHHLYELSNINYEEFDEDNKKDVENLLKDIKSFIVSYSKVLQFLEFADIECPSHIWSYFNSWKNNN